MDKIQEFRKRFEPYELSPKIDILRDRTETAVKKLQYFSLAKIPNPENVTAPPFVVQVNICSACNRIARLLQEHYTVANVHGFFEKKVKLGSVDKLSRRSNCSSCQHILQHITLLELERCRGCPLELRLNNNWGIIGADVYIGTNPSTLSYRLHRRYGKHDKDKEFSNAPLSGLRQHGGPLENAPFAILNSYWIDMNRVRQWPLLCDSKHGQACRDLGVPLSRPEGMLLIDVYEYCLCEANGTAEYLALSYVWGIDRGVLETRLANVQALKTPGVLKLDRHGAALPETIRDSMSLARIMACRYLWVDRLCVIQDDDQHVKQQLQAMAAIYSTAYFTIIAAAGRDATYGLRGIGSGSKPRDYEQKRLEILPQCKLLADRRLVGLNQTRHQSRGWTFQETLLSRRMLIFSHEKVYWECQKCFWDEELAEDPVEQERRAPPHSNTLTIPRWPNMSKFSNIVLGYSQRALTFESDILDAFSAISQALSQPYGGMFYGLPEGVFEVSLLWSTDGAAIPEKRLPRSEQPSWSWIGWKGGMSSRFWHGSWAWARGPIKEEIVHVFSITEFYKTRRNRTRDRVKINTMTDLIPDHKQGHKPIEELPPGWNGIRDKKDNYYFVHGDLPNGVFRWPFAIPTAASAHEPSETYTTRLSFRTRRLYLRTNKSKLVGGRNESLLVDPSGTTVGIIQNCTDEEGDAQDEDCELIAIAKSVSLSSSSLTFAEIRDDDLSHYGDEGSRYWYYNVLWIEWDDRTAFRKSIGRVLASYWDSNASEEIRVRLG